MKKAIKNILEQTALRAAVCSIAANLFLALFKLILGLITGSNAMISDSVHSAADVSGAVIVIIGVMASAKEADSKHPYGHERLECVAAIVLAVILFITGAAVGYSGLQGIINPSGIQYDSFGVAAIAAAALPIVVKWWMYRYMMSAARKSGSETLRAEALHQRVDSLSSLGSIIGMTGVWLGFPILDSIACTVISLFILRTAGEIFISAVRKLIDESCGEGVENEIRRIAAEQEGVLEVASLRTRKFGSRLCVDVEVTADIALPLTQSYEISSRVRTALQGELCSIKHCMVYVLPAVR